MESQLVRVIRGFRSAKNFVNWQHQQVDSSDSVWQYFDRQSPQHQYSELISIQYLGSSNQSQKFADAQGYEDRSSNLRRHNWYNVGLRMGEMNWWLQVCR
jgi:hypothetical protein